jgi:hypothetical protein
MNQHARWTFGALLPVLVFVVLMSIIVPWLCP